MAAPSPSPLDRLPGRFPLCEIPDDEPRTSGNVPPACRISDPFKRFPQRSYHLSRLMYAHRIERMMRRAAVRRRRQRSGTHRLARLLQRLRSLRVATTDIFTP